jgi:hypothetical protein
MYVYTYIARTHIHTAAETCTYTSILLLDMAVRLRAGGIVVVICRCGIVLVVVCCIQVVCDGDMRLCAVYTWQVPPRLCVFEYLAGVLAQNEFCCRGLAVATESGALGAGFGGLGV